MRIPISKETQKKLEKLLSIPNEREDVEKTRQLLKSKPVSEPLAEKIRKILELKSDKKYPSEIYIYKEYDYSEP